jgi:hypothetical protein
MVGGKSSNIASRINDEIKKGRIREPPFRLNRNGGSSAFLTLFFTRAAGTHFARKRASGPLLLTRQRSPTNILFNSAPAGSAPTPAAKEKARADNAPSVDLELVVAVDVSYSMDLDELSVQREGYAHATVSKEFLQALKNGPQSKIAVTYFEWSAQTDQKMIIPWRVINGPETADAVANEIINAPFAHLDLGAIYFATPLFEEKMGAASPG